MSARVNTRAVLGRAGVLLTLSASLMAATLAFCQSATAQNTADQSGQNATDQTAQGTTDQSTTGALQEVVVTAERRAENIQTTPISIVAISGDQLAATQITDISSLDQVTPNLVVFNSGTASTADIRGVGNSNQGGIEQPGVLVVRDGLPNNSEGTGLNVPNFDIADIEVLRGPQGTFAGDNSTGGVIDMNSANPNFRGINGYLDATAATYSEQRLNGAVNLPVSDTFALRLSFNEETRGSFFHDEYSDINGPYEAGTYLNPGPNYLGVTGIGPTYPVSGDKTVYDPGNVDDKDMRIGLLWKPTDNFQSLTKIEFDYDDSDGVPQQPDTYSFSPLGPGLPCPPGEGTAPNCHSIYYSGYSGSPYVLNDAESALEMWQDNVEQFSEEVRYTLPGGTQLRAIGGDQEIGDNNVASTSSDSLNYGYGNYLEQTHIYSAEVDALSPTTGPFSWIAGANFLYNGFQLSAWSVNTAPPYSASAPSDFFYIDGEYIWEKEESVFGQVSWQFTHTLQLVAGVRNGWDSEVALGGLGITLGDLAPPIAVSNQPVGGPPSDRVITGKIDLNWAPAPGQYFYAFAARGYKPGEENLGVEPPTHYEWVNDYELGWKGTLAGGHVQTQLGGYYMQYYDMIYSVFNGQAPEATSESSIPYSNLKGIEFSMQSHVGGLGLNVNAAYNKSVLGPLVNAATYKFPVGYGITPQCGPGETPNATLSNCTNYKPYEVTLTGESLPYAPDFTANATLQYSIPVGSMAVVPRVSYAYTAKSYASIFQSDDYYLMPSHGLLGAYLDWDVGPWTTTIYGTNLANTLYLTGTGLYGNPRQLGLEMRRTF